MALELARTLESNRETVARTLRNPKVADDRRRDHLRIITGPQPYRHSYFAPDQFFHADPRAGVVRNIYGQRVLRVTENYLRTLIQVLSRQDTGQADRVLFQIGRAWGEANMREFAPRIEQEFEVDFEKMGMGVMLESWWWSLRASGWGTCRFDFRHARRGLVFVGLQESAVAAAVGHAGSVACQLYAGLFSAVFSFLAHRDLGCVELECMARGDAQCKFLVAAPQRVEAAISQRNEGAAVEQIIERLSAQLAT